MKTKKLTKIAGVLSVFACLLWGGVSCNMNPTAPSEHTVTFDTDGGSAVDPVQVKDGETVSIPETTKEGYDFVSWYNGDVEYDFSSAVTSDITLTAKWKEHEYKITYELNGGKNNEKNPTTYTINTDDFTIIEPVSGSAETPNFLGWYSDKDLTKPAELTIKKGSKGDLTFYAKWTNEKLYTVTFKYTGVENTAEPKTAKVKDGDALSADQIAQVKAGLPDETEYVAMYTDEACTKEFNQETKIAADTTIYVKVKQVVRHAVTVNWVGTESSAASLNVKDGETVKEDSIKNVIPKGYGYVGTYSDKDCTTVFDFATKITADTVLYVKVNQIVKYTVTFNSNGGSEVKAATVVKGEKVTKPTDPTREGYAFKGWFNGETEYDFDSAVTADITLVAKWEVDSKIVYIMSKATQELSTSNQWSQVNLPLSENKAITSGDWIIVSGKVSMQDAIGQVYVQWGTSSGQTQQLGSFYKGDNTTTEKTVYWIYKVPVMEEGETVSYAQLACQKANNGQVQAVEQGTKITLTDFFIARLPKADIDRLTVKIAEEESAEMTKVKDITPESIQYSPSVNLTVPTGKIVCLYDRGEVKVPYKSHYINGGYKNEGSFTAIYPDNSAQSISIVTDVPEEKKCEWFQVGLQEQGLDSLTITNLEVRVIPDSIF